jgi:hypothetical protein
MRPRWQPVRIDLHRRREADEQAEDEFPWSGQGPNYRGF